MFAALMFAALVLAAAASAGSIARAVAVPAVDVRAPKTFRAVDVFAASVAELRGVIRRARYVVDRFAVAEVVASSFVANVAASALAFVLLVRHLRLSVRTTRRGEDEQRARSRKGAPSGMGLVTLHPTMRIGIGRSPEVK